MNMPAPVCGCFRYSIRAAFERGGRWFSIRWRSIAASLLPFIMGMSGWIAAIGAVVLGSDFLIAALMFAAIARRITRGKCFERRWCI